MLVDNNYGNLYISVMLPCCSNSDLVCSKPDGTLITAHGNHIPPHKSKAALGSKANVLFEFIQVRADKGHIVYTRWAYWDICRGSHRSEKLS